jgi:hypothetical protein
MVFIKIKIVSPLKFRPKFNKMLHQYLSKINIYYIINFLKFKKKIKIFNFFILKKKKKKKKKVDVAMHPLWPGHPHLAYANLW